MATKAPKNGKHPEFTVEHWSIDRVIPYARNPRKNAGAVAKVAASLREFGWRQPLVVAPDRVVVVGHTRLLAARELGMSTVPVHVAKELTAAQLKAYRLADNRTAEEAEWDGVLLGLELADLKGLDFDLALTGFDPSEIAAFTAVEAGEESADVDLTPPKKPKSERGVVYTLGRHRVMCGDSTDVDDVARLMDGRKSQAVVTSPPYGDQRGYGRGTFDWDAIVPHALKLAAEACEDRGSLLVNLGLIHDDGRVIEYWRTLFPAMEEAGRPLFAWYVWDKGEPYPGDFSGRFPPAHEWVFHFATKPRAPKKTKATENAGDLTTGYTRNHDGGLKDKRARRVQSSKWQGSVIHASPEYGNDTGHPAPFSVAFARELIEPFADTGEIVHDPFGGSGTVAIACEPLGVEARMMELSPAYCDVIRRRYAEFVNDPSLAP